MGEARRRRVAGRRRHAALEAVADEERELRRHVLAEQQAVGNGVIERFRDLAVIGGEARVALFHRRPRIAARRAIGCGPREGDVLARRLAAVVRPRARAQRALELLDEAVVRARALVEQKNPDLTEAEKQEIARAVGIGAVKYADLCRTRTNDYSFSWEQMLSFDGNTAPYLQYAYARICSLFRKASLDRDAIEGEPELAHDAERQLAIWLIRFAETVEQVAERGYPHELCNYLYQLAALFMSFYEQCPVLREGVTVEQRQGRLVLAAASASVLRRGLDLLGFETLERM